MKHTRLAAGFTLIEVLVALALGGLVGAAVAGSVWSAVRARQGQAAAAEAEHRARVTRTFLREVVRGLAVERESRGDLLVLASENKARQASDRVLFSTRAGAVFGWDASLKAVELLIDDDPSTPVQGLVARVLRQGPDGVVRDTLSLMPDVAALQVRLLDRERGWVVEWEDPARAPLAVEFRFTSAGPSANPLLELPLHARVP